MSRVLRPLLLGALIGVATSTPSPGQSTPHEALRLARRFETQRIRLIEQLAPSVVCILGRQGTSSGSGVIIHPAGYGLTNFHVIAPLMDTGRGNTGLPDGRIYPLRVLGIDVTGDVAMFKLQGPYPGGGLSGDFPFAPLGDSESVRLGDWALVLGNPFALAQDYTPAASLGIISGTHRYQKGRDQKLIYTDCLQTDAAINPGNSGGPLFDFHGRLIGINGRASFEARGRVSVGLGYAISINQIKRFIPALRAGLLAEHGQLGATVYDDPVEGVVVDQIQPGSPAWQAGLRLGDRLQKFAGRSIQSQNQFLNVQGTYPAGWPVQVVFEQEGQRQEGTVRLQRVPVDLGPIRFQVDRQWNRDQAWRVLRRHRARTGGDRWQRLANLTWQAERDSGKGQSSHLTFREQPTGPATMSAYHHPDRREVRSVTRYDGQSAVIQRAEGQRPLPTRPAAILNVARTMRWLLATINLDAQPGSQWQHAGGDALGDDILEMLEYRPTAEPQSTWRIGFDSVSWQWRVLEFVGPEDKTVRLIFGDHRPVDGLHLPHRLQCWIDERLSFSDQITDYQLGFAE